MAMSRYVFLSLLYLPWFVQRRRGWQIYGINLMLMAIGLLASLVSIQFRESVECFPLRLQDKAVKVIWLETKSGSFSVRSLDTCLELGSSAPFSETIVWNS